MKNKLFLYTLLLIAFSACNSEDRKAPESENDLDAARNFVRAALDGRYDLAKKYMLQDSVNMQYLENVAQRSYARAGDEVARAYKAADINVHNVSRPDSLTTIVIYSNTYKNDRDT